MLDDLGLIAALEWQSFQISKATGMRIDVSAEGFPETSPEEHKTCIFRIVQEALNNVCRHAKAKTVNIHVNASETGIVVMVQDDGKGFARDRTRGLGLIGMQERVEILGGTLIVDSGPGKGTIIGASIPLPPPLDARTYAETAMPCSRRSGPRP
jgi:signal transduction histidine kinase